MEIDPVLLRALEPCLTDRRGDRPPVQVWLAVGTACPPDSEVVGGWSRCERSHSGQRWSVVVVTDTCLIRATAQASQSGTGERRGGPSYVMDKMAVRVVPLRALTGYRVEAVRHVGVDPVAGRARYVFDLAGEEPLSIDCAAETDEDLAAPLERVARHLMWRMAQGDRHP